MRISKHLWSSEFDCNDGTPYPANWLHTKLTPLCAALEIVRAITGRTMTISSGYRTPEYNKRTKGAATRSKHMEGIAADFRLKGITPAKLFPILDRFQRMGVLPKGGLHAYSTFVHIDQRGFLARW